MIEIKQINSASPDFESVKKIRKEVFISEQGAVEAQEFDCYDEVDSDALFLLLFEEGLPLGTARLVKADNKYKIGRIALLKECRGKGYGALIVRKITELAFAQGATQVYVDAQNYAVPFYAKLGFVEIGSEITDRGLPHIPMCITRKDFYEEK